MRTRADAYAQPARTALGDRGITVGDLYAYAYDHAHARYNVVKLYAYADARVTRHLVSESPDAGTRSRERPRWTDNTAQPMRPVRAFDPWDGTRMHHGQRVALSRSAPRIVRVAPGNPASGAYVAHECPREPRATRIEWGCRCNADGVCRKHADANTRTH
jgi:hypothetical protein